MTRAMPLPRALAPFLTFAQVLRGHGFLAAPDQTRTFIAATGLLGPASLRDIRRAAHATFGPPPERHAEFDALFDKVFLGMAFAAPAPGEAEDLPTAYDAGDAALLPEPEDEDPSGAEATALERLTARAFAEDADGLRAFARAVPRALPRRRARRLTPGRGRAPDPSRTFRAMLRHDGEITRLPRRTRQTRQRRVLLLIDVSGSMKAGTEGAMRLSHALVQAGERVEVFTLGTRLTRVSRALRHRNRDQALIRAAGLVADWDGGTRLGEALQVFLAVPRFAGFARGALVVVLSDGLERGGPEALVQAMDRMRGLAWSVLWLSPLAADPAYRVETGAMRAIAPMIDRLGNGATPQAIAAEILTFAKGARAA
ncbi:MAG: VWA domain-containing protein [Pseudotabrizicola sp.]|uniref:vWA domain-containing protein n=1 Tax=Pseudotabrizicola sp. TaxID=2939647 RepID=UPI00271869E0|nr:VWA domain-containing protein [Pseudotabrizicola sp.]MDO9637592.1 VWA domain-containing protein [Pseudotabrizicola sp.]